VHVVSSAGLANGGSATRRVGSRGQHWLAGHVAAGLRVQHAQQLDAGEQVVVMLPAQRARVLGGEGSAGPSSGGRHTRGTATGRPGTPVRSCVRVDAKAATKWRAARFAVLGPKRKLEHGSDRVLALIVPQVSPEREPERAAAAAIVE